MRTLYEIARIYSHHLCLMVLAISGASSTTGNVQSEQKVEQSYFFSDKESNAILSILTENKNKTKNKHRNVPLKKDKELTYKLSGILFVNPHNWTVWINGKAYHSINQYKDFYINRVSRCSVLITCRDGNTLKLSLDMNH